MKVVIWKQFIFFFNRIIILMTVFCYNVKISSKEKNNIATLLSCKLFNIELTISFKLRISDNAI